MEPFLAEIRAFAFGVIPRGWTPCEGQLLNITTNVALYSLLGIRYGGNGTTTFALPDLRGRVPVYCGTTYTQGVAAGEAEHTLTVLEMPQHTHFVTASSDAVSVVSPQGATWASFAEGYSTTTNTQLGPQAISAAGGSQPHPNMQPFMAVNYCIATSGIFPSRN